MLQGFERIHDYTAQHQEQLPGAYDTVLQFGPPFQSTMSSFIPLQLVFRVYIIATGERPYTVMKADTLFPFR